MKAILFTLLILFPFSQLIAQAETPLPDKSSHLSLRCVAPILSLTVLSNEKCRAQNGAVSVACLNGQIQVPQWSNGVAGLAIGNLSAGIYTVTVTNIDNCTASQTVPITNQGEPFTAALTTEAATCEQANGRIFVTTNAISTVSLAWSDGSTNVSLQAIRSGNYSVTLTNAENCTTQVSIFVPNIGVLPRPTAWITADKCSANTGSITLTSDSLTTQYRWNTADTTAQLLNLAGGVYSVTISQGFCSTASTFLVVSTPPPVATIQTTASLCDPNDIALIASFSASSFGFLWNNGSTTDTLKHAFTGIYTVTITDVFGCTATASQTIENTPSLPFTLQSSADTIYLGETVTLFAPTTMQNPRYYWYPIAGSRPVLTIAPTASQRYFVGVSNPFGCTENATAYVVVLPVDFAIPSVFSPNGDGENDYFYVVSNAPVRVSEFKIYNRWGNVVYDKPDGIVENHKTDGWDGTFNGEPQAADTYIYTFIVTTFDGKQNTRKGEFLLVR